MDEFLENLRKLFSWGGAAEDDEKQILGRPVDEVTSDRQVLGRPIIDQQVDVPTRLWSRFQNAEPIFFNLRQDPKVADAARRTDRIAYPTGDTLDQTIAMNADELKDLLKNYYDANDWNSREQAASAIRSKVNEIDPERRSSALSQWVDYFNGGHQNLATGQNVVDFDYFMQELGEVLDDSKKVYIRRA